jgi:hypothetical protein
MDILGMGMGISSGHDMMAGSKNSSANPSPSPMATTLHRDISSSSVPMQRTVLMRDVSSSTNPHLLDELQIRQDSSHHQTKTAQAAEGVMNFPPGYAQYQQQNQTNVGLYQDTSSAAASRLSEFLPSSSMNVVGSTQSQEWSHHNQNSMRTQYSALPPFSGDQYLPSNPTGSSVTHQQSTHDNIASQRTSGSFALPPIHPDQQLHFQQNLDEAKHHQASMQPPTQHVPSRMNDYTSAGGSPSHNMNGWDVSSNGVTMGGGTWTQSGNTSLASGNPQQLPSFQAPSAPPPLSSNPFEDAPSHHQIAPPSAQPNSGHNRISDDSLMVDSMFASMGASSGTGDEGLLNALNSVNLGDASLSQAGGSNWGKIAGWAPGEEENTSGLFAQQSRLGDYREER